MNDKENAREAVEVAATIYHQKLQEAEQARLHLSRTIREAKDAKLTQQQIADKTVIQNALGEEVFGLSRQRIGQILES